MSIRPLTYPQLSHQQVVLNNLVCGLGGQLQSQLNGAACHISLHPVTSVRQFDLQFVFDVDGLPVSIQTTRDLFSGIAIGGSPLTDILEQLPDDLRIGCATMVTDRLLADLKSLLQKNIRLSRISRCDHLPEGTAALGIEFKTDSQSSSGLLILNDQITSMLHNLANTASPPPADDLVMPMPLEIGCTILADTRLAKLATGDVVLFDRCWHKDREHIFLRLSASSGFLGRLNGNEITLEQRLENAMSDDDLDDFDFDDDLDLGDDFDDDDDDFTDEAPAAQAPPPQPEPETAVSQAQPTGQQVNHSDIHGLPVKLQFDIGSHELTVGDMGRLGPGYTFELNRDTASPVTMKANGKPFAECELVQINNQLGARIVRLL